MKTEKAAKPQKLFAITISVYVILTISILAACFLVRYPITYTAVLLNDQASDQNHLKLTYAVTSDAILEIGDEVTLTNKFDQKFEASVFNITSERDKLKLTLLVKSNPEHDVLGKNRIIQLTKHQKLFVVLVNKLN